MTLVERFFAPLMTLRFNVATGAIDVTESTSRVSASISWRLNGLDALDAPPVAGRPVFDAGRRAEIRDLLAVARRKTT